MKKQRFKHNYTTELEIKCLLIRVKNKKIGKKYSCRYNDTINRYVKLHSKIGDKKYSTEMNTKKARVRAKLKERAIELSEITNIDDSSYEHFGNVIMLMIGKILTKPNFSGYTYRDDFYSDAIHKILKYLHNFDHTKISQRSGINVNAFAYISQIIHNSIVFIINTKNKEIQHMKNQVSNEIIDHNLNITDYSKTTKSTYYNEEVKYNKMVLYNTDNLELTIKNVDNSSPIKIYYPNNYRISLDEYDKLRPYLKNISLIRNKETE